LFHIGLRTQWRGPREEGITPHREWGPRGHIDFGGRGVGHGEGGGPGSGARVT